MSPSEPARGSQILLKAGTETEPFKSRWLSILTQFRELFNEWRNAEQDQRQDWWVASTAIPLVAATTAPLANLMSVVALVTPWRNELHPGQLDSQGLVLQTGFPDPRWCVGLNASSVAMGLLGNLFLLFNFTEKMPYIIALPASICLWFLATGILVGALLSEHVYIPPIPPNQVYSSGFWSAVIAAVLYFILATILLINMLGYILGHYPHRFALTDDQRTLILQTTSLMIWLAVGAAIFEQLIGITFSDALYFSDVTILTLGFGDIVAQTSVARGLIFPYAVIGIVILALIIASISRFARELTNANVVKSHLHHRRAQVLKHSSGINDETELATFPREEPGQQENNEQRNTIQAIMSNLTSSKRSRMLIMREEKDRFDAMRAIQDETLRFRRWLSLMMSLLAFVMVWCGGAGVFASLESLTYFEALYFGFCCLLTIGYGDITPTTNPARPFFVVWSLIAIPTMTILISKMSDTIMSAVDAATNFVAKYTVLPEKGRYTDFVSKIPKLRAFLELRAERQRIKRGFVVGDEDLEGGDNAARNKKATGDYDAAARPPPRTLTELEKHRESPPRLARDLIFAIRRVAQDVVADEIKRYSYEEWVEFTQLIRFTNPNASNAPDIELDENEWGLIEWDWMGENSPMMAEQTEPEWVLNRLTESLLRFMAGVESRFNENGRDGSHTFLFQKEERNDADGAETDHCAELASESESRLPASESSTR